MIRTKDATFRVGEKILVDSVSMEISTGEVLAILGPNGAGKSTLLKMLCGQNAPQRGEILYDDQSLGSLDSKKLARRRAVLPQSGLVPFDFTALEIVLLGRSPHSSGVESKKDIEIAREAMALTDTGHLSDRLVATLSGGELQRVHLARVLSQIWEPVQEGSRVLFLDEPTSSLDLAHQHGTLRLAGKWAKQGVAVAVILHDLNLAALYADRLMMMKDGKSVVCGTPVEVLTTQWIQEIFDLRVLVQKHPENGGPLVIPV